MQEMGQSDRTEGCGPRGRDLRVGKAAVGRGKGTGWERRPEVEFSPSADCVTFRNHFHFPSFSFRIYKNRAINTCLACITRLLPDSN